MSEFHIPTFRNTLFHLHRHLPAYEDGTDSSETLVYTYTIQTPGNYPEEGIEQMNFATFSNNLIPVLTS